jgi:hypothetical protein
MGLCLQQGMPTLQCYLLLFSVGLLAILQVLAHVPPMQRERVAQLLMMPNYLRKLLDIFRVSSQFLQAAAQPAMGRAAVLARHAQ